MGYNFLNFDNCRIVMSPTQKNVILPNLYAGKSFENKMDELIIHHSYSFISYNEESQYFFLTITGLCMRKFVPMEDTPLTLTATLPRDITRGRLRLILRQTLMLIQKQERERVTDTQDLQLTLDMDLCQHHMVSILGLFRDMLYLLMLKVFIII